MLGWTIYAHPCFLSQYEGQIEKVEALRIKFPDSYQKKADTKILAQMLKAIQSITHNPRSSDYRPGDAIGEKYTDWSRVKFGNGRYRLFFRYSWESRVIVLAWVNDSDTLRTYGSKTDAYKTFGKMLKGGRPPHNWEHLLKEAMEDNKE